MTTPELANSAAHRMAEIIIEELEKLPPQLAIAIVYETAQSHPAIYFAHQGLDACNKLLAENRYVAKVDKDDPSSVEWHIGNQVEPIFNTGNWEQPADPVFLQRDQLWTNGDPPPLTDLRDAVVEEWARLAFQAIIDGIEFLDRQGDEPLKAAGAHIRATFWDAIDRARRMETKAVWPPISFVCSTDDYSRELLFAMVMRRPIR